MRAQHRGSIWLSDPHRPQKELAAEIPDGYLLCGEVHLRGEVNRKAGGDIFWPSKSNSASSASPTLKKMDAWADWAGETIASQVFPASSPDNLADSARA